MINDNILAGLEPHDEEQFSPAYFVVIEKIEPKENCKQESVVFKLSQINRPIEEVKEDYVTYSKELTITGIVDIDDSGYYFTKLTGYEGNFAPIQNKKENTPISSHHIEVIETKLNDKIEITFEEIFKVQPSVIINIDKEYETLYKKTSVEYKKEEDFYTGLILYFENLKKKKDYPTIKINIIGDLKTVEDDIEEETTEESG